MDIRKQLKTHSRLSYTLAVNETSKNRSIYIDHTRARDEFAESGRAIRSYMEDLKPGRLKDAFNNFLDVAEESARTMTGASEWVNMTEDRLEKVLKLLDEEGL